MRLKKDGLVGRPAMPPGLPPLARLWDADNRYAHGQVRPGGWGERGQRAAVRQRRGR